MGADVNFQGDKSWGNVNMLNGKYVDVFGIEDKPGRRHVWWYTETYTGGISPTARYNEKEFDLKANVKVQNQSNSVNFLKTKKTKITLKEVDFRLREHVIKAGNLYTGGNNKGTITITNHDGEKVTVDLSKRLDDVRSNHYVEPEKVKEIEISI